MEPVRLQEWARRMVFWHDRAHSEEDKQNGQATDGKSANADGGSLCKYLCKVDVFKGFLHLHQHL